MIASLPRTILRLRAYLHQAKTAWEDDYQILRFIGQGASSRVYEGVDVVSGRKVIIKMFKQFPKGVVEDEIMVNRILASDSSTQHVPLIKMVDAIKCESSGNYILIFQRHLGRPLNFLIHSATPTQAINYVRNVLQTLKYIHNKQVIHRDVKPTNILISDDAARLFDFGLGVFSREGSLEPNNFGTKCYKTPEVILRMSHYTSKVDMWAIGLVFAELLLNQRHLIFYRGDFETILLMASLCNYGPQDAHLVNPKILPYVNVRKNLSWQNLARKKGIEGERVELVKRMLSIDPSKRPTAEEVLLHPLFDINQ